VARDRLLIELESQIRSLRTQVSNIFIYVTPLAWQCAWDSAGEVWQIFPLMQIREPIGLCKNREQKEENKLEIQITDIWGEHFLLGGLITSSSHHEIASQRDACAVLCASHFSNVLRTTKTQTRFLIRILANSPLLRPHSPAYSLINMQMGSARDSQLHAVLIVRVALEAGKRYTSWPKPAWKPAPSSRPKEGEESTQRWVESILCNRLLCKTRNDGKVLSRIFVFFVALFWFWNFTISGCHFFSLPNWVKTQIKFRFFSFLSYWLFCSEVINAFCLPQQKWHTRNRTLWARKWRDLLGTENLIRFL